MLNQCTNLDDYFQAYGDLLGVRANAGLAPLHNPGVDPDIPGLDAIDNHVHLVRQSRLFGRQRDTISGMVKALRRQKAIILAAKPGTGKSLMSAAAAHCHAAGKPYRGLVMCPDHLIKKWGREIELTVPGARWRAFATWRDVLAACQDHTRPTQPEWWIIGRDQSKGDPAWETRVVKHNQKSTSSWNPLTLQMIYTPRTTARCPRCGHTVTDKDKNPMGYAEVMRSKKKLTCKGQVARYQMVGDDCEERLTDCGEPLWSFIAMRTKAERAERKSKRKAAFLETGTAPYRWPAYRSIKGHLRRPLDYLILDEVHELKGGDDVAQANAAGAFISRAKRVMALTGTVIGGYADHLFPLLMRMAPESLVRSGYTWGDFTKFNGTYGRIETTITTKCEPNSFRSNSHSKGKSTTTRRRKPGIMPQLYGDHLMDKAIFLSLEEVSEGLPSLHETIIPLDMSPALAAAYEPLREWLADVLKPMLARGDKRLLATMLENLLYYPDHPFDWPPIAGPDEWYQPLDLDKHALYPKEEAILELCRMEHAEGRQVWVYVQRVGDRDVASRLVKLLGGIGLRIAYEPALRAAIMRSSVSPREREEWIYKRGRSLDVCISHPDLVKTGLDLFAHDGNHNYPTLIFDQTGYNSFTLNQAKCRSWRIGQRLPCRTIFLYYRGTMQEIAMAHMGKKTAACEAIDGKFSADGLAALAGDDDATMALAKALIDRVGTPDTAWTRNLGFDQTPMMKRA